MHAYKTLSILLVGMTLALTAPVRAQEVAEPAPRGSISAFSGFEFVPSGGADVVFAAEYAEHVDRDVQAYVAFTYFENLMSPSLQDEIAALGTALTAASGVTWDLHGRDRGASLLAGAKFFNRSGSRARPYVGAGAGVLNVRRTIRDVRIGDVTRAVFNDYGIGRAALTDTSDTVPLVEVLAGLGYFAARHTYVDIGYRYRRAFRLDDGLNLSQVAVGVGYRF